MMKSGLSGAFLLLLLLLLCTPAESGLREVLKTRYDYYKNNHRNWEEAQSHCRGQYNRDLAIMYSQADTEGLTIDEYFSWIRLFRESQNNWQWENKARSPFRPWAQDEPDENDDCGFLTNADTSSFHATACGLYYFFICHVAHDGHSHFKFELKSKTWLEAQKYCKDLTNDYSDTSNLQKGSDLDDIELPEDFPVWTGLHRDEGAWKWTRGLSDYKGWSAAEPGNNNGDCASISSLSKKMSTTDCNLRYPVLCYWDNLVLVNESKTWEEALEHCRALWNHDLVSVQPGSEHSYMMKRVIEAHTDEVWTGLRFLAGEWLWVNGADLQYTDLPACPLEQQHCGTLSKQGDVKIRNCSETRNFLCYF
ncbi:C-type mannose receptor 2-like [Platichthys flesus]|uniref:C-type mannose receptor 2-like n=1 Tax=Platichthys flesus TaxID=8260 RepID=UPI002DBC868C|nr:C-type mannose receptor 2-like [Platichthys flesus]